MRRPRPCSLPIPAPERSSTRSRGIAHDQPAELLGNLRRRRALGGDMHRELHAPVGAATLLRSSVDPGPARVVQGLATAGEALADDAKRCRQAEVENRGALRCEPASQLVENREVRERHGDEHRRPERPDHPSANRRQATPRTQLLIVGPPVAGEPPQDEAQVLGVEDGGPWQALPKSTRDRGLPDPERAVDDHVLRASRRAGPHSDAVPRGFGCEEM